MDTRIAEYEPFVQRIVWLVRCPPPWLDDACQEARIAVWQALQSYDPSRGCKESTWVWDCAYRAVVDYLRMEGRRSRGRLRRRTVTILSLDELRGNDDSSQPTSAHNLIPAVDDPSAEVLGRMEVEELCRCLTPPQLRTLKLFALGYRGVEIARMLDNWQSEISRRRSVIRRKWKEICQCA